MAVALEHRIDLLKAMGASRARLAIATVILILSGAAGLWHVLQPPGLGALILYTAGLTSACYTLWPISSALDSSLDQDRTHSEVPSAPERQRVAQCENKPVTKAVRRTPTPNQSVFDFDGMGALRARESIDGAWLVSEASLEVIETVRAACRAAAPKNGRMARWFEIVVALNTARHSRDEKAEVRRTQIAMTHGVSEEQTRQIDQGRYGPLNRIIAQIDPSEL